MNTEKLELIEAKMGALEGVKEKDIDFKDYSLRKIKDLITGFEFQKILYKLGERGVENKIDYSFLTEVSDTFSLVSEEIKKVKEDIDYFEFQKEGEVFDFKRLKEIFKEKKLRERYPKFNFKRYKELVKEPVLELTNFKDEKIKYDSYVVKKIIIGINQMIFDEMDLRIMNVGKEGAGKSLWSSQLILYIHWFLSEVGLIQYDFEVTKLFFSSLENMLKEQDIQENNDFFRIYCLDEGYELNRMNYREEGSMSYKDSMRSDRKMLRIELLNLPQLGELETSITLTRTNFIFYSDMYSDVNTGTVKKGDVKMYILPRGKVIYSPYQRRNLTDKEITNTLSSILKDKNDSYKGLPDSLLVHRFQVQGVWGFNKDKYDAHIKKENRVKRVKSFIKMTDYVGYILYKKLPKISHWGTFDMADKADKKMYGTIQKFLKNDIQKRYLMNEDIRRKFDILYSREKNE